MPKVLADFFLFFDIKERQPGFKIGLLYLTSVFNKSDYGWNYQKINSLYTSSFIHSEIMIRKPIRSSKHLRIYPKFWTKIISRIHAKKIGRNWFGIVLCWSREKILVFRRTEVRAAKYILLSRTTTRIENRHFFPLKSPCFPVPPVPERYRLFATLTEVERFY